MAFGNAALLVLALDTTTRAGSAAVVEDGHVRSALSGDPTLTHGQRLPGDLARVLEAAGAGISDVDLFAVAAGPGSFTGLRVGIAAVQGLAIATNRRIVPVSALDALARAAGDDVSPIATWMDAQRGQVYSALYDADRVTLLQPPSSLTPDETLATLKGQMPEGVVRFIGDGAVRYAEIIQNRMGPDASLCPPAPPLAAIIARIAFERADWAVLPHAVVPIYIRRPDAEIARGKVSKEG